MTTSRLKIHLVAAARPNFMKIAPLYHELKSREWALPQIIHTGQHYDSNMSKAFFEDLNLPKPEYNLDVGSGTHAEQTGQVMIAYEKVLRDQCPDLVVVVGDVNSTMAAAIAAVKIGTKTAHLEAGLRSFDRSMPEEINRVITDAICDLLWTPSRDADHNLENEGVVPGKIIRVGNIMIDSFEMLRSKIEQENMSSILGIEDQYGVVTLHRPSNVDNIEILGQLVDTILSISEGIKIVFPVHPRTLNKLEQYGLLAKLKNGSNIRMTDPLSYIKFMSLIMQCQLVITDSGGIQEETTYLGIPCLTLRPNTERPITVTEGTNRLCNQHTLRFLVSAILERQSAIKGRIPELWDGRTAERIVSSIEKFYFHNQENENQLAL